MRSTVQTLSNSTIEATYVETGEMLEPDVGDDGGQGPDTEFEGEGPGAPGRDGSQAPF